MSETIHIHKAAGILIQDRKLLVERSHGKEIFIAPGGSIEDGETAEMAVVRELFEEFGITVDEADLSIFGVFKAQAAGQEDKVVEMTVFNVHRWRGEPTPHSEVAEQAWISSQIPEGMQVGSIFEHDVIPQLKAENRID